MHPDAYPPPEPKWQFEVTQSGIGGLEEPFRTELVGEWKHFGVVHDPTFFKSGRNIIGTVATLTLGLRRL